MKKNEKILCCWHHVEDMMGVSVVSRYGTFFKFNLVKKSFSITFCGLRFFPTFCQISLAKNSFYATEVIGRVNCILNTNGLGFIPELFPQV